MPLPISFISLYYLLIIKKKEENDLVLLNKIHTSVEPVL